MSTIASGPPVGRPGGFTATDGLCYAVPQRIDEEIALAMSRNSSKNEPFAPSLFGDLAATESFVRAESIIVTPEDSLNKIFHDLRHTHTCGVCKQGMPVVFGVGNEQAELMLIGEGPGVDDYESQQPFQGPAGLLLTKMLAAIGLSRQECYICNVIKCIPPGERNFSVEEIEDCRPILLRQILAVRPAAIIAFGSLAAQTLLRTRKTITELRGNQYTFRLNEHEMALFPTFNPAYLLRVAEKKKESWDDLRRVRDFLR